jgi:hypothetical protein
LTELYLYGFAVNTEEFVGSLFPCFGQHILELLPKYSGLLLSSEFFLVKQQKAFAECFHAWMQAERLKLEDTHARLLAQSRAIQ